MPKPLLTRPETRNLTGTTLSTAPIQQQKLQTQHATAWLEVQSTMTGFSR